MNDLICKIDWDALRNFEVKKSETKNSFLSSHYNKGCKTKGIKCMADFLTAYV